MYFKEITQYRVDLVPFHYLPQSFLIWDEDVIETRCSIVLLPMAHYYTAISQRLPPKPSVTLKHAIHIKYGQRERQS